MRALVRHGGASDFDDWSNGCRGKVPYPSLKVGKGAARVLRRDFPDDPNSVRITAYRCATCRLVHVGHSSPKRRRQAEA